MLSARRRGRVRASSASCRNSTLAARVSVRLSDPQSPSPWISSAAGDGLHRGTSTARLLTRSGRQVGHIHDTDHQGKRGSSGAVVVRRGRPPIHPCHRRLVRPCFGSHGLREEGAGQTAQPKVREETRNALIRLPAAIREWAGTSTAKLLRLGAELGQRCEPHCPHVALSILLANDLTKLP